MTPDPGQVKFLVRILTIKHGPRAQEVATELARNSMRHHDEKTARLWHAVAGLATGEHRSAVDMPNPEQFREKAREARQRMDQSPDPDVRRMWRDIAEHYDYLADHAEHPS
jgi:hypothetical protein